MVRLFVIISNSLLWSLEFVRKVLVTPFNFVRFFSNAVLKISFFLFCNAFKLFNCLMCFFSFVFNFLLEIILFFCRFFKSIVMKFHFIRSVTLEMICNKIILLCRLDRFQINRITFFCDAVINRSINLIEFSTDSINFCLCHYLIVLHNFFPFFFGDCFSLFYNINAFLNFLVDSVSSLFLVNEELLICFFAIPLC